MTNILFFTPSGSIYWIPRLGSKLGFSRIEFETRVTENVGLTFYFVKDGVSRDRRVG